MPPREARLMPTQKEHVMDAVRAHFRPEFINRISSIVVFNRLSKSHFQDCQDQVVRN